VSENLLPIGAGGTASLPRGAGVRMTRLGEGC